MKGLLYGLVNGASTIIFCVFQLFFSIGILFDVNCKQTQNSSIKANYRGLRLI
jgi:hypothetical protein